MVPPRVSLAALLVVVCVASTIKSETAFLFPDQITSDRLELTSFQRDIIQQTNEKFSLELFSKLSEEYSLTGDDFIASPISIWSLLWIISEGATDLSREKLQTALGIPYDKWILREAIQLFEDILNTNTSSVEISTLQALFPNIQMPVSDQFKDIMKKYYEADLIPVDYTDQNMAAATINNKVRLATKNLFSDVINPQHLIRTGLVMLATSYFKGQWKFAFDKTKTLDGQAFYNEAGKEISKVSMMTNVLPLAYLPISEFNIIFVELPYGNDDRFSMVLLLPINGNSVRQALGHLKVIGVERLLAVLDASLKSDPAFPVEVRLPKFSVSSGFTANMTLQNMGLEDIFTSGNLENIHPSMIISKLQQDAKIIVNEDGEPNIGYTIRISPAVVEFNRPFAYIIVDKETKLMLFCGQVMKPTYNP